MRNPDRLFRFLLINTILSVAVYPLHSEVHAWEPEVHEAIVNQAVHSTPDVVKDHLKSLPPIRFRPLELSTDFRTVYDYEMFEYVRRLHDGYRRSFEAGFDRQEAYYLLQFASAVADLHYPGAVGEPRLIVEGKAVCRRDMKDLLVDVDAMASVLVAAPDEVFTPYVGEVVDFDDITQQAIFYAWMTFESLNRIERARCEYRAKKVSEKYYYAVLEDEVAAQLNAAVRVVSNGMVTR